MEVFILSIVVHVFAASHQEIYFANNVAPT